MARTTMRDVARHANVSVATVSHVINKTRFVKPETERQVLESIALLGYRPDAAARSFKTGRRNLIAFVVPDIANSFFSTLIEEAESVLNAAGYQLLVVNTKETEEREINNIRLLSSGIVDGFIIASTLTSFDALHSIIPEGMPVVLVDRLLADCDCDSITVNAYDALYEGVERLIQNGHRKIGYITGLLRISTTIERLRAYKDAMNAHGLLDESRICVGDSMSECVTSHLTSLVDAGCTALVITNNLMAEEAMTHLLDEGIRPGRDIELLGFRDSNQPQYGLQHMHLVVQPTVQLGRTAAAHLLDRLREPDLPLRQTVLQAVYVPRGEK